MDGLVRAELAQPGDATHGSGVLEQQHELVPQPSRREVSHDPPLDALACEPGRVVVETEAVALLVADGPEDPCRIVDEGEVVEHPDHALLEVPPTRERVDETAEVGAL